MPKIAPLYRTVTVDVPANAPYLPPRIAQEEAWAVKAFLAGKASEAEQGIVARLVLGKLSGIESFPHYPTDRDTVFANGKRYVGHHLLRISRMEADQIAKLEKFVVSPGAGEDDEMPTF
jgi:hypothetical protein